MGAVTMVFCRAHQDALWRQAAVNDAVIMRISDGFRDLHEQRQTIRDAQCIPLFPQKMIQPSRILRVTINYGGATLSGDHCIDTQKTRMIQRFDQLRVTAGSLGEPLAVLGCGG